MPVSYVIEGDVLRLVMEGTYSPEDIKQGFADAFEDPRRPEHPRFVFDVSRSEILAERSTDEIKAMARFLSAHADRFGMRCAALVSRPIQYGLSRMGAAFTGSREVEVGVFGSLDDAVAWLEGGTDKDRG